jgi:hypothetical protein
VAFKYFNVKNGLSAGNINLNASNATVETGNLIVSGESNLGSVSNIIITGGSSGQVLTTDGSGNLSFSAGSSNPAPMPYQIDTGETVTVPNKYQGLFAYPITVDGELEIDGILIEVGQDALESVPGQILYDNNGIPSGNAGFTFDPVTGNLAAPGNISGTNFIGNGSQLTGIIAAAGSTISNGTSNVNIAASGGNVTVAVGGTSNIIIATSSGVNVTGTLNSTGNANVGNIGAAFGVFTNIAGEGGNISNIQGGNINGTVATSTTAGTVTTNAQPNITSVGTLTSLDITGNVTTGNVSGTTGAFTNVSGNGSSLSSITGANVTGQVGNALVAGTVYTNAQPNITSVGTLSGLAVTGNVTAGNVYANSGTVGASLLTGTVTTAAQPNITSVGILSALDVAGNITSGANIVTDLIIGKTTSVSIEAAGTNQNIFLKPSGTGKVDIWGKVLSNVAAPIASTDAATKQYVDDIAQGLHTHDSCNAATSTTLASSSSGTVTYDNGTAGVGATLTTTGSYTTIDGVTLSDGMRILVKNEANTAHNGIYDRTSTTVLTRSSDFDTPAEMAGGDFTFITAGTLYDNTGWVMIDVVTTVGTSPVDWVQFSGAGTYQAGTGLTLTGSQFNISNTVVTAGSYGNGDYNATFTVNAQGQLTAAANVAITANAANLTGTTLAATIVNSSLTSVGTLANLSVTGNVSAGNANLGNLATANFFTGTLTTAAQPNITSVGTLTSLAVSGNLTAANLIGNFANGTTDISIPTANGNINFDIGGTANVFVIAAGGSITSANVVDAVGYKGIPQNSQTSQYTLALTDIGKHISITTGGVVVPANGSVAFPIGATIVLFNNSASTQSVSITTDTLRQAGTTNTGTRTLAAYGVATLIKVASTVWVISGNVT